jgi:hypothetical protein
MKKSITILAIAGTSAGLFALAPARASAWAGYLIKCVPASGTVSVVDVKPGFNCDQGVRKLSVKAARLDNCQSNPAAAATWDAWAALKFGSKITSTAAATIDQVDIALKAVAMGTCNFSATLGDPDAGASGSGKLTFYTSDGVTKVKGGGAQFIAQVSGTSTSGGFAGLITKGIGLNAEVYITIGIDPGLNPDVYACNTGGACPPAITTPAIKLNLKTQTSGNELVIGHPLAAECEAASAPYHCCTGEGTGTCSL